MSYYDELREQQAELNNQIESIIRRRDTLILQRIDMLEQLVEKLLAKTNI